MSETASFGYRDVDAAEKAGMVRAVFSNVAAKYDLMNDAMSGGAHRLWKDQFVRRVKPQAGEEILDMAGGTGDIAFRMAGGGAEIIVADINQDMLDVGLERAVKRGLGDFVWSCQNAEELSFADRSFDAYTIAFGIRNVTRPQEALNEAYRVLKPGGRLLCLEFSQVTDAMLQRAYDAYSFSVIPAMGKAVTGDRDSYQYLVESIRKFPDQETFLEMVKAAGFGRASYRNYTMGVAAIHSGWRI